MNKKYEMQFRRDNFVNIVNTAGADYIGLKSRAVGTWPMSTGSWQIVNIFLDEFANNIDDTFLCCYFWKILVFLWGFIKRG